MVMPAVDERRWTAVEVQALPDVPGTRYECVDGMLLVTPAPSRLHQLAQAHLLTLLNTYLSAEQRGIALAAPMEYMLDTSTVVQPDISVIPFRDRKPPRPDAGNDPALLVIQILSPSTARYDHVIKRDRYQRQGLEYWIVDADRRVFERWRRGEDQSTILSDAVRWRMPGQKTELVIDVPSFFTWVRGD